MFIVWIHTPNADCSGWNVPQPSETFPSVTDAHAYARMLRRVYHGHLVSVCRLGVTPKQSPVTFA